MVSHSLDEASAWQRAVGEEGSPGPDLAEDTLSRKARTLEMGMLFVFARQDLTMETKLV